MSFIIFVMNRYKPIFAKGIWEYMKGANDVGLNVKLNKSFACEKLHITKDNVPEIAFGTEIGSIKVTSFHHMFEDCDWITEIKFDDDIRFDHITNVRCMFKNCTNLKRIIMPKRMFTKIIDSEFMFQNCHKDLQVILRE